MKRFITAVGLLISLALVGPALASATTFTVGHDLTTCPRQNATSIQAAVTAASSGDTIKVCPGTYIEQVTVPAGKNNLTLVSTQPQLAIIQAPPAMTSPKAIVRVQAQNTSIQQFTIQGPGDGGCDSIEYGVRVDGGGSALIVGNHITHIRDLTSGGQLSGCQNGVGVQVGRAADATTGSATIQNNQIDDYQKNGITISNTGSTAEVKANTVQGFGPAQIIAQNGIQVSSGASADVKNNDVSGNVFAPGTATSTGILLFSPGATTVANNTVHGNDSDIFAFSSSADVNILSNETSAATFDGIDIVNSSGVLLQGNNSHGNASDGVYLNNTSGGNVVRSNQASSNGEDGINLDSATNNTLRGNTATGNARYGVHAGAGSTGNVIQNNTSSTNTAFDCKDDTTGSGTSGTANSWTNDHGQTSSPLGICKP